jgi:tetratricopeptide (TPR) repeat protein
VTYIALRFPSGDNHISMLLRVLRDVISNLKPPIERDILIRAGELCDKASHEEAIEILTVLLERKPDCVPALMLRGVAKRQAGRVHQALADFSRAEGLDPSDAHCLFELAASWYALGNHRLALEYCERGRRIDPESTMLFALMAQIKLGGEFYSEVIARILDHVKPRTYVEIGVFRGDSLRLAKPPMLAVGIDPEPQLTAPLAANHRVFAETSDAFFACHDLRAELGGLPVDLAFIDGMHHFEFALRDFANIERHCTRDSIILIHDCYPLDQESAGRAPRTVNWSGDIWRLIVLLKKYRPDLAINTIGTPPTGLGLVRNLDPNSRLLIEHHDRLREEFLALDYSYLDGDMPAKLNLIPNQWEKIRALLV